MRFFCAQYCLDPEPEPEPEPKLFQSRNRTATNHSDYITLVKINSIWINISSFPSRTDIFSKLLLSRSFSFFYNSHVLWARTRYRCMHQSDSQISWKIQQKSTSKLKTNSVSAAFHWVRIHLLANPDEDPDLFFYIQTTVFDDGNWKMYSWKAIQNM